jgi:hypothetical protein
VEWSPDDFKIGLADAAGFDFQQDFAGFNPRYFSIVDFQRPIVF